MVCAIWAGWRERLGFDADADFDRSYCAGAASKGSHAGKPERLLLCAGQDQREIHRGAALREADVGERPRRSGAADAFAEHVSIGGGYAAVAELGGRVQLVQLDTQPADRAVLCEREGAGGGLSQGRCGVQSWSAVQWRGPA